MTVESLRLRLQRLDDSDAEAGTLSGLIESLARFDPLLLSSFVGLLDKIKVKAPPKPKKPKGPTPEQLEVKRLKDEATARKKQEAERKKKEAADKKVAAAAAKQRKADEAAWKKANADTAKAQLAEANRAAVAGIATDIENFLDVATKQQPPQSVVEARLAGLTKLSQPQLMELTKLLKCDAGLPASATKGKVLERIRDMVNRTIGTAARVKM